MAKTSKGPTAAARSLLFKLDMEVSTDLTLVRLEKRLVRQLEKKGVPADLTAEESAIIEQLGFDAPKTNAPKADAPKADAPKADAPKADAPKATKKKVAKKKVAKKVAKKAEKKVAKKAEKKVAKKKTAKKAKKADDPNSAVNVFKRIFAEGKSWMRDAVVKRMVKEAKTPAATVSNYISWAKQYWKPKNPFGFFLEEKKNKDGAKVLTKRGSGKRPA